MPVPIYFNPAGMTLLQGSQISLAGDYVSPSAKFWGARHRHHSTATGGDAGKAAVVPSLYFATDILSGLKFGLGVNAPFGMMTEYDFPWAGMTQAVKSELTTVNVNPSLAWAVNDRFSLGIGVNWQSVDAELSSYKPGTGIVAMKGNDNSWGLERGGIIRAQSASRIGLSYRSQVDYQLLQEPWQARRL